MTPDTRELVARLNRGGFVEVHYLPAAERRVIVLPDGSAEVWEPRGREPRRAWMHVADWPAARVTAWLSSSRRAA